MLSLWLGSGAQSGAPSGHPIVDSYDAQSAPRYPPPVSLLG